MKSSIEYRGSEKFKNIDDSEKILRTETLGNLEAQFDNEFSGEDAVNHAKAIFLELEKDYGIRVPVL